MFCSIDNCVLLGQDRVSKSLPSSGSIEEIQVFYTNVQMLVDTQGMLRTISKLMTNLYGCSLIQSIELCVYIKFYDFISLFFFLMLTA